MRKQEISKGCKIGDLIVVEQTTVRSRRGWVCKCKCGSIKKLQTYDLKRYIGKECICKKSKYSIGDKIGKLTIESFTRSEKNILTAVCKCECGNYRNVETRRLGNRTTHCGCYKPMIKKRVPKGYSAFKSVISSYRSNSRKRGLPFLLEEEFFRKLVTDNCHYCGCEPYRVIDRKGFNGTFTYNGVDRLNSDLGYVIDNVVTCCKVCNYLKNKYSYEEFLEIISKIYENLKLNLK